MWFVYMCMCMLCVRVCNVYAVCVGVHDMWMCCMYVCEGCGVWNTYIHTSKNCNCFFIITAYACFKGINIISNPSENVNYPNTKSHTSYLLTLAHFLLVLDFQGFLVILGICSSLKLAFLNVRTYLLWHYQPNFRIGQQVKCPLIIPYYSLECGASQQPLCFQILRSLPWLLDSVIQLTTLN